MEPPVSLYAVLEVSPCASTRVIKAAYRALAQFHHPDKRLGAVDAEEQLALINHAYAILSDPALRLAYDQLLQSQCVLPDRRGRGATMPKRNHLKSEKEESRPFVFRELR